MGVNLTDSTNTRLNASGISQLPEQYSLTKEYSGHSDWPIKQFALTDDRQTAIQLSEGEAFVELSIKKGDGFVSRKFDFGKLLKYIDDSLSALAAQNIGDWLSQDAADQRYVRKDIPDIKKGTLIIKPVDSVDTSKYYGEDHDFSIDQSMYGLILSSGASAWDIEANGSTIKAKAINAGSVTAGSTSSTDATALTVHGKTELNAQLDVNGNINNDNGSYVAQFSTLTAESAGITTNLVIEENAMQVINGELSANGSSTFNALVTVGNWENTSTTPNPQPFLVVKGELACNGKIDTANLHVTNDTEFDGKVTADQFIGNAFALSSIGGGNSPNAGMSNGNSKDSNLNNMLGIYQTFPQIAQLTAQAACWS